MRRQDPGSHQVDLIWTRRQDPETRQVDLIWTRRQDPRTHQDLVFIPTHFRNILEI